MRRIYICDSCDYTFEHVHDSMHDPLKKKCPECGKLQLYQDLSGQHTFVYGEPENLAHQAHRNTKRMGRYELQEKREKDGAAQKQKTENKKRWYNPEGKDLTQTLSHLKKPQDKHKYIMEGQ